MKRSVAIYGPTPQFVRWAIRRPCPLRELDEENLPESTFRQLRGVREFSVGKIESRIFESICLHPGATSSDVADARGFFGHEVLDIQGGESVVAGACENCPANSAAMNRPGLWAGCYGWLPATTDFSLDDSLRASPRDLGSPPEQRSLNIVELLDDTISGLGIEDEANDLFFVTTPRWYGIWRNPVLHDAQIEFLRRVFNQVIANAQEQSSKAIPDVVQFRDALARCKEFGLSLHVDLIPPGNSDGVCWRISAHCPDCRIAMTLKPNQQRCSACGRIGNPHGQRKSKVLGLRPFVNLVGVLGEKKTVELLHRYEQHRRSND